MYSYALLRCDVRESLDMLSVQSPRHLLFLNLDVCLDSSGDTQEALYDLLTSLTSMVKTSCAALVVLQAKQAEVVAAEVMRERAASRRDEAGYGAGGGGTPWRREGWSSHK